MARLPLVAIIAAYNEEDIIGPALRHLVEQGASVYLLDDGSTDRTVAVAQKSAGGKLIGIEALPPVMAGGRTGVFSLTRILERKAALARTLDADWFINHDADEFRESPWPHLSLVEAVGLVDRLGFNAIDFEVFHFVPPEGDGQAGKDVTSAFRFYRPAAAFDKVQIRCWKQKAEQVELTSTGGHEARFPGRRVFPIRFPMRHYPIRSADHARRKVLDQRVPRFDPGERARGWHVQYDRFPVGEETRADGRPILLYDPDAARVTAQVANRLVDAAGFALAAAEPTALADVVAGLEDALAAQHREAARAKELADQLSAQQSENMGLREANHRLLVERDDTRGRLAESTAYVETLICANRADDLERERLVRDASDLARRLEDVHGSKSWRITAPLRAAWRLLGGR
jgi:hypothetical protein